jgi:hypothetical protein
MNALEVLKELLMVGELSVMLSLLFDNHPR